MSYTHLIFDLDGTLIDTETAVLQTWQRTLADYGYSFGLEEMRVVLGVTTDIGLARLGAKVDERYAARWQKNYEAFAAQCDYFPGAKAMLLRLRQMGCHLGAVSSRSRREYDRCFAGFDFDQLMETVVLEEDTQKHKPDAEPLLKYMELAHARAEDCLYVGDMPTDALCARSAGVAAGLVRWNGSAVDTSAADFVFSTPDDLLRLLTPDRAPECES